MLTSLRLPFPTLRAVLRGVASVAAFAAATLFGAAAAEAGDPVKLLVELPPDVKTLDCGETVDIQVVGEDAGKLRVGFPGKNVELSATFGTVEVIKQPYQFRYKAPATLPDVTNVRIRAWLKEAPEVVGETIVQVIPPAPFKRLVIQGAGSTPAGASLDLLLRGEAADGQLLEVPDATVTVTVAGPGKVTLVRTSRYRFEAAADGSGTAKVTATLNRYPKVTGTLDILVTGGAGGGAAAPPVSGGGVPAPAPAPAPAPTPPAPAPVPGVQNPPPAPAPGAAPPKPAAAGKPATDDDPGPEPVVWTSGSVKLETWRLRDAETDALTPIDRKLPAKGAPFIANKNLQKVRVAVIAPNAAKVEVEEWVGDKNATTVTQLRASKDGRFQLTERKDGTRVVHYEVRLPEGNRPTTMAIVVTLADGKVTRDEFVFRRSEPKK